MVYIYFIFRIIVSYGILSLQYVNSMNYIVRLSLGSVSDGDYYGSPFTHRRSSLNLALQWHLCWPHVQCNSHGGTMFFGESLLNVLAFRGHNIFLFF